MSKEDNLTDLQKEYLELVKSIGPADEIRFLLNDRYNEDRMIKMIDFIKKNKIDFTHLWDPAPIGRVAYENYEAVLTLWASFRGIDLKKDIDSRQIKKTNNCDFVDRKQNE